MCDKVRILFVDDEPNILSGLQRMLRVNRDIWTVYFATGGQEALNVLAETPVDIVVSDMRMPGMNGMELLKEVSERYPDVIRFALSGQASKDMVLDSIGAVHQYLAKPCDVDVLKNAISQISSLRHLVSDKALRSRLTSRQAVPSIPAMYDRLLDELLSPEVTIDNIAEIVSHDLGMSARVLQLVSSAFMAEAVYTLQPAEATVFLGADVIREILPSGRAFSLPVKNLLTPSEMSEIIQHSLAVANCAKAIAVCENVDKDTVKQAYVAGLFHDIGKQILPEEFPNEWTAWRELSTCEDFKALEMEQKHFGLTHAEVGAYLMGLWGLSDPVIEAIAFHHNPAGSKAGEFTPLLAVHVADTMANKILSGTFGDSAMEIDEAYLEEVHLGKRLETWVETCRESLNKETANV